MIFGLFGGDRKWVAEMLAAAKTGDVEAILRLPSGTGDTAIGNAVRRGNVGIGSCC